MKSKSAKKLRFGILFSILAVGILFLVNEGVNDFPNAGSGRTFTIPLPDSFTGATSTNINPEITCNLKSTVTAIDSAGGSLESENSSLLSGNPLLDLTNLNHKSMAGFVNQMKIHCSNTSGLTLIVPADSLSMYLWSNNPSGSPIQTALKTFSTKSVSFPTGSTTEHIIGYASVYASEIENKLPTTPSDYISSQKFQIVGSLDVHWQGYSTIKYEIPINNGQVVTYMSARIVNDDTTLDPDLADPDGDGIINLYDFCDDQRETFNGFEDSDGCPDVAPDTSTQDDTPTPDVIVTQDSCNADGKTWYIYSSGSTLCGTAYKLADGSTCDVFDSDTDAKVCLEANGKVLSAPISSNDALIGKMLWQVDVVNADNTKWAFLTTDDQSPFSFEIPLNSLTGGKTINESNQISKIVAQGMIKINDEGQHNLSYTKTSDVTYNVSVKVGDALGWVVVKEVKASGFIPRNGASANAGMSIGTVEIRVAEIENKVLETLGSTFTGTEKVRLRIVASGDVGIDFNDGGSVKSLNINLPLTPSDNETQFIWTNLAFTVAGECPDVNNNGICDAVEVDDKPTCASDENLKATSVDPYSLLVDYVCVKKGAVNPNDPLPKIGDEGVEICHDDNPLPELRDFPCTLEFRDTYCSGTTQCGSEGTDGSTLGGNTGGVDECPSNGLNTLDISGVCLTVGGDDGASGGSDISCTGAECTTTSTPIDTNLIMIGAVGLVIIGMLVYLKKRG